MTRLPTPIPADLAELIAGRLRVIADPTRIRILDLLREGELTVTQITERLRLSQQNVSKHLGILLQAGIVARRKEGTSSYYRTVDEGVYQLCEQVCGGLEAQLNELGALLAGTIARARRRLDAARGALPERRCVVLRLQLQ
jgi:DNA-binding transcriptional ArsR family regulator